MARNLPLLDLSSPMLVFLDVLFYLSPSLMHQLACQLGLDEEKEKHTNTTTTLVGSRSILSLAPSPIHSILDVLDNL